MCAGSSRGGVGPRRTLHQTQRAAGSAMARLRTLQGPPPSRTGRLRGGSNSRLAWADQRGGAVGQARCVEMLLGCAARRASRSICMVILCNTRLEKVLTGGRAPLRGLFNAGITYGSRHARGRRGLPRCGRAMGVYVRSISHADEARPAAYGRGRRCHASGSTVTAPRVVVAGWSASCEAASDGCRPAQEWHTSCASSAWAGPALRAACRGSLICLGGCVFGVGLAASRCS